MNRRRFVSLLTAASIANTSPLGETARSCACEMDDSGIEAPDTGARGSLSDLFPDEYLASHLAAPNVWHPYPRWGEREPWLHVPDDVRAAVLQAGQTALSSDWKTLTASEFLEFQKTGNRTNFENQYLARRDKLALLVLAECVEGGGRFLGGIIDGLWLLCEESFWGVPAHLFLQHAGFGLPDVSDPVIELFGAETGALLAWTDYLVGSELDRISRLIRPRLRLEASRRILQPGLDRVDFPWMGLDQKGAVLNNWNPWINSNWLTVALLLEPDSTRRLKSISKIIKSLDAYFHQCAPDGSCPEGPEYWDRSAASFFESIEMLSSASGTSSAASKIPLVAKMGGYVGNVHIAGDYFVNFGDAHAIEYPSGDLIFRFGQAVHDPQLAAFGVQCAVKTGIAASSQKATQGLHALILSIGRTIPAILDASTVRGEPQQDALVRDAWYPDLHLMAARQGGNSTKGFYLAAQAASNGRSHGHCDSGSFIVFHDGDPVIIDLGPEAYTAKTFSSQRSSLWTVQSAFHNLPTINGVMQGSGLDNRATHVEYHADDTQAGISLDLASAYPKTASIERWNRRISLDRTRAVITLEEAFDLQSPMPVFLSIMTPRKPNTQDESQVVLASESGQGSAVVIDIRNADVSATSEEIPLTDPGLKKTWGPSVFRVKLSSKSSVSSGHWMFQIRAG